MADGEYDVIVMGTGFTEVKSSADIPRLGVLGVAVWRRGVSGFVRRHRVVQETRFLPRTFEEEHKKAWALV